MTDATTDPLAPVNIVYSNFTFTYYPISGGVVVMHRGRIADAGIIDAINVVKSEHEVREYAKRWMNERRWSKYPFLNAARKDRMGTREQ